MAIRKFNYKKAVNNRYKSTNLSMHKLTKTWHSISREDYLYKSYYDDVDICSLLLQECRLYNYAESADYERYERWLNNGGRY